MPKVTDITVLNIDEKPYAVESLTDEIKALVEVYNEWNRKEADVRDELTRFQAAKETLSRQIIGQVREHIEAEEAAKAAESEEKEGLGGEEAAKAAESEEKEGLGGEEVEIIAEAEATVQ